jgi:glycosyltransferase 2 family protein
MKKFISALKYLIFFSLGALLFWWVYKDMDLNQLKNVFHEINYWWLFISFLLGMFSHVSRSYRWNMLIQPLGYKPRVLNTFLSIMVMYLVNLALPRAGEIARCSVLTKYEKIPFTKLVGTVVIERITDVIALAFFACLILFSQVGVLNKFLSNNAEVNQNFAHLFSLRNMIFAGIVMVAVVVLLILFRKQLRQTRIGGKIGGILISFLEGLKTVGKLKNKWAYIGHTCFIYLMWLIAMYVVFFSYPPTSSLSFAAAMVTFVMGGLAMIAPVQGGIGAYHFMIAHTLIIFGISLEHGIILALIAWAISNIALMIAGSLAFILLPIVNRNRNEPEPMLLAE